MKLLRVANSAVEYIIKINTYVINVLCETSGISSLVVARPTSRCGKPSSNRRKSDNLSLLLLRDWQFEWYGGEKA